MCCQITASNKQARGRGTKLLTKDITKSYYFHSLAKFEQWRQRLVGIKCDHCCLSLFLCVIICDSSWLSTISSQLSTEETQVEKCMKVRISQSQTCQLFCQVYRKNRKEAEMFQHFIAVVFFSLIQRVAKWIITAAGWLHPTNNLNAIRNKWTNSSDFNKTLHYLCNSSQLHEIVRRK